VLVTVARFRDPWEAEMFRGRLEFEDIPAFVIHQHHIAMNWMWSRALHGVKVQVLSEDVAAALEAMERCLSGEYGAELLELFGYLGEPQCPNCGSIECKRRGTVAEVVIGFVVVYFFAIIIPPSSWRRTCRRCGTRWVDEGEDN
jgi:hypothetical protein